MKNHYQNQIQGIQMFKKVAIAVITVTSFSGCASIVTGSNQSLSVESATQTGQNVVGATCKLVNDKGSWFLNTPGTVTVQRSYNDLNVACTKDGHEPGIAAVKSTTKGMMAGNILFGGFIGAGVDASTGAAYDYPSIIKVMMGGNAPTAGSK